MPSEIEIEKIRIFEDEEWFSSQYFLVDWFILYHQKTDNSAETFLEKISRISTEYPHLRSFYLQKQCYFVEPDPDKFFNLLIDDLENNENRTITDTLKDRIASNKKKFFKNNPDLVQGMFLD
jgi:hypothetical protein